MKYVEYLEKNCVQLPTSADNVALPASSRRTPLLLTAGLPVV